VGHRGQGCDGVDNNCHGIVDGCLENTVAPVVKFSASTCTTFATVGDALQYVKNSLVGGDDWVGT